MKVEIKEVKQINELPCLMKNKYNEIFLMSKGIDKDTVYATKLSSPLEEEGVITWESNIEQGGYEPLPKGYEIKLINK